MMGGEIKVDDAGSSGIFEGGRSGGCCTCVISAGEDEGFSDGLLPNANKVKDGTKDRDQSYFIEI